MANLNDLELDVNITGDGVATNDDMFDLMNAVFTVTESGEKKDPAPSHHDVTIPVPSKTEITADQYNRARDQLIRSLKESADLLAELDKLHITEDAELSPEELQDEFTESMMLEAALESYLTGPYFESAKVDNKEDIVKAIKAIKDAATNSRVDKYGLEIFPSMKQFVTDTAPATVSIATMKSIGSSNFSKQLIKNLLGGAVGLAVFGIPTAAAMTAFSKAVMNHLREDKTIKTKLWQMVGSFYAKDGEIDQAMAHYNELFADKLGEGDKPLKLGMIKLKVNRQTKQKNYEGHCYLLTVDNKAGSGGEINITIDDKGDSKGKKDKGDDKPETEEKK